MIGMRDGLNPHGDELADGDGGVEPIEGTHPVDGGHDDGLAAGGVQQVEDPVPHEDHQVLRACPLPPLPPCPLEQFPKGLRFLRLHFPCPPEHGLRPAGRVQQPPHPSHPHTCPRSDTM